MQISAIPQTHLNPFLNLLYPQNLLQHQPEVPTHLNALLTFLNHAQTLNQAKMDQFSAKSEFITPEGQENNLKGLMNQRQQYINQVMSDDGSNGKVNCVNNNSLPNGFDMARRFSEPATSSAGLVTKRRVKEGKELQKIILIV